MPPRLTAATLTPARQQQPAAHTPTVTATDGTTPTAKRNDAQRGQVNNDSEGRMDAAYKRRRNYHQTITR